MVGDIVKHTEHVAAALAATCAGDPAAELLAWIRIAQQREAMVVELYEGDAVERRIPAEAASVSYIARKAMGAIWAQEAGHTSLLGALRNVGEDEKLRTERLLGSIEGKITDRASSDGWSGAIARWLVGLGRLAGVAPDFTRELQAMPFEQFCAFSAELEETAAGGYQRMLELSDQVDGVDASLRFGVALQYEVSRILAEERFHRAVFETIPGWLTKSRDSFVPREARRCVEELRDLGSAHLAWPNVHGLPEAVAGMGALDSTRLITTEAPWVSEGGLGALFLEYGLDVPVLDAAEVKAAFASG